MPRIASISTLAAAFALLAACSDAPAGADRDRAGADLALVGAETADLLAAAAKDDEAVPTSVYRFRSIEDPDFPPDPAVCAAAPFAANVRLGASLWSEAVQASEGRVVNPTVRRIGTATACIRITDPTFPPGLQQRFYGRFDVAEGTIVADGTCTLISNDVPRRGLVLGGCNLRVIEAPPHVAGGAVTSLSVFNPARLSGFATGSVWTLQLYGR